MKRMQLKLFPNPSNDLCTPFVFTSERDCFVRLYDSGSSHKHVVIQRRKKSGTVEVDGLPSSSVIGNRLPDRDRIQELIRLGRGIRHEFVEYVRTVVVVPTFSLCPAECFVRAVIRQLISAKQASRLFSDFVKYFGIQHRGSFGFPSASRLCRVQRNTYAKLGLGMKTERIQEGIKQILETPTVDPCALPGVGPWSRQILTVEKHKSYRFYPFWDKSGEKIHRVCGINLSRIAERQPDLAADLYIYAASFLESMR
jgi:hypothetical protein